MRAVLLALQLACGGRGGGVAAALASENKRVMVWTTDDTANTNATARASFLQGLSRVKDVVNVVSPCSYYIQQVPPHNLVRKDGADTVHQALKAAGFAVQPLVGDIGGGWNMSWYRDTFVAQSFADAAVKEIQSGGLEGLNFDYEPHQPGTDADAAAYVAMVQSIMDRSKSLLTIDFPCNGQLCHPPLLKVSPPSSRTPSLPPS